MVSAKSHLLTLKAAQMARVTGRGRLHDRNAIPPPRRDGAFGRNQLEQQFHLKRKVAVGLLARGRRSTQGEYEKACCCLNLHGEPALT